MRLRLTAVLLLVLLALTPVGAQKQASVNLSVQVNHDVILTWTASTSTVVGYNVYRGGVAGGPYSKIGTLSSLTYSDTIALAGQTYFYVVRAVDSGNTESVNSNEVSAVVPTP